MKTERVYKDRLRKLAKFLETKAKPSQFDITVIGYTDNESEPLVDVKEGFCGTAACAIGHCPVAFPKAFDYRHSGGSLDVISKETGAWNFEAAQEFFGLNNLESEYLFGGGAYNDEIDRERVKKVTPKRVAKRIRKFVRDGLTWA